MNIYILSILGISFSAYGWHITDIMPQKFFALETKENSQFFKVSAPTEFTITQQQGRVKVKGWDKEGIEIKITKKGSPEALANTLVTLNKEKLPHELSCFVGAHDEQKGVAEVTIEAQVPFATSLNVHSRKGVIKTKNLSGIQSLHADHGPVEIKLSTFTPESSLFVHTKKGSITVQAPAKLQAQLSASTLWGSVTSELLVTLQPHTTRLNKDYWNKIKREIHGSLGEGGAPITLESENGDIKILAKK